METEERDLAQETKEFLEMTGSEFFIEFSGHRCYFPEDKESRDVYRCVLGISSAGQVYEFEYGQSIANVGIEPLPHEVLGCLETYDYESFENFCDELGYDPDSRSTEATYKKVADQSKALIAMYNENELECLRRLRD